MDKISADGVANLWESVEDNAKSVEDDQMGQKIKICTNIRNLKWFNLWVISLFVVLSLMFDFNIFFWVSKVTYIEQRILSKTISFAQHQIDLRLQSKIYIEAKVNVPTNLHILHSHENHDQRNVYFIQLLSSSKQSE